MDFIPSKKFKGRRPKFVFKTGERGLGYYRDYGPGRQRARGAPSHKKRRLNSGESGASKAAESKKKESSDVLGPEEIARILAEADNADITVLDSVRTCVVAVVVAVVVASTAYSTRPVWGGQAPHPPMTGVCVCATNTQHTGATRTRTRCG